ncbi:hypothetical protein AHAS_Ahas09G0077200 [Arachis hypogaea]
MVINSKVGDLARNIPLLLSWICHGFSKWCPDGQDMETFPLTMRYLLVIFFFFV